MGRVENVIVFKDTENLCKTNNRIKESIQRATASQKLILEKNTLPEQMIDLYETTAKVVVSKKRTLEAAGGYKGNKIAVHNFASASNPVGGVFRKALQRNNGWKVSITVTGIPAKDMTHMVKDSYVSFYLTLNIPVQKLRRIMIKCH